MSTDKSHIRNFSIIAHIDHGKSTLADRLLERTGALSKREMADQVLDAMDLERERGITIKAHSVRLNYRAKNGEDYVLNLIDTPGHVDFSYEVSRSLSACEGALLVVDASQGVEAQTLANTYLALDHHLEIIPVINKIDLPGAEIPRIKDQLENIIGLDPDEAILASAKEGIGTEEILEAIVHRLHPPKGEYEKPLKALIFDSWFDSYRGVIVLVRVIDGTLKKGQRIRMVNTQQVFTVEQVGVLTPKLLEVDELSVGEVGYVIANIKRVADTKIGDTITEDLRPTDEPFPASRKSSRWYSPDSTRRTTQIMRHCGTRFQSCSSTIRLSSTSPTSGALGFGFRCGFLGLLHMEIVQERLEREFNLSLITTAPGVRYRITTHKGEVLEIHNPSKLPPATEIAKFEEPMITAMIMTNNEYVGPILKLAEEKRGVQKGFEYVTTSRVLITYELPLNEIVLDFYDKMKSASRGYASLDYHFSGYQESRLVRLDILVAGEPVDALSLIIHQDSAAPRGRALIEKMKELIPRQMFEVVLQAAIGSKIIAREVVRPMRKNVLAKCYGGDITRKRKLLEKQKEGKKRMKRLGKVEIPQEAFLAILKVEQ